MPSIDSNRRFADFDVNAKRGDRNYGTYSASTFSHEDEKSEPGYYSVKINNRQLLVELTSTRRVGFHRYTFPKAQLASVYLDLAWRDQKLFADAKVVGDRRIEGERHSRSWAKDQKVYFVIEFSKPFKGIGSGADGETGENSYNFGFDTDSTGRLLVKVAISYVSIEGARKNLEAELPHWDFDKVRADAKAAWNKELRKIDVSGGTPEQTTNFYTALYHTMIHPNVFNDVDGRYKGHDGKIHQLPGYVESGGVEEEGRRRGDPSQSRNPKSEIPNPKSEQYTVFSLWDTFRAAHPLYTIIDQKRTVDFINTFIRQYEQGGRLPVWELWGEETDTMIGYHAVSVIADAMAKGIKGFDYDKAYEAAKHSAELDHHGLAAYKKRGYISMEDDNESVSKTLEYAYNDWCVAQMARIIFADVGVRL
jgi:putative alpha-1,2-mannosidase